MPAYHSIFYIKKVSLLRLSALRTDTINRMANTAGCYIVPVYREKQGHPVLLEKQFIPAILNSESNSLRDCLKNYTPVKQRLCIDDKGIITDIDTIREYEAVSVGF